MSPSYISGGKLGDFIQQLSVVYERFMVDGGKATVYMTDRGDTFRLGVQKAHDDLAPILSAQPYIKEFKVWNGEPYDVDLTSWRKHASCSPPETYLAWMMREYGVEWGKHPWVTGIPTEPKWQDVVVVNTTSYRFPDAEFLDPVLRAYPADRLVFVGFSRDDYDDFVRRTQRSDVRYYCPGSLHEMFVILKSCRLLFGSLSSPLSIALSMHARYDIGFIGARQNYVDYLIFHNIDAHINNKVPHTPMPPPPLPPPPTPPTPAPAPAPARAPLRTVDRIMPTRMRAYLKK